MDTEHAFSRERGQEHSQTAQTRSKQSPSSRYTRVPLPHTPKRWPSTFCCARSEAQASAGNNQVATQQRRSHQLTRKTVSFRCCASGPCRISDHLGCLDHAEGAAFYPLEHRSPKAGTQVDTCPARSDGRSNKGGDAARGARQRRMWVASRPAAVPSACVGSCRSDCDGANTGPGSRIRCGLRYLLFCILGSFSYYY